MTEKIRPDHLRRTAYVYVRQSSAHQVRRHQESRQRQYALADRSRALGFAETVVIDEDQGKSGSGRQERSGFGHLLTAVCQGHAGAVFALEASRLARALGVHLELDLALDHLLGSRVRTLIRAGETPRQTLKHRPPTSTTPWRASCEKRVRPSFCLRPRGERGSADGTQRSQDDSDHHCGRGAGAAGVHGACLPVMRASTREEMRRISSTSRSSSRLFSIHSR